VESLRDKLDRLAVAVVIVERAPQALVEGLDIGEVEAA